MNDCIDCKQPIHGMLKPPGEKLQRAHPDLCGPCLGERWRAEGRSDEEIEVLCADSLGWSVEQALETFRRAMGSGRYADVQAETERRHNLRAWDEPLPEAPRDCSHVTFDPPAVFSPDSPPLPPGSFRNDIVIHDWPDETHCSIPATGQHFYGADALKRAWEAAKTSTPPG